jgi:hypothetical protein
MMMKAILAKLISCQLDYSPPAPSVTKNPAGLRVVA